MLWSGFSADSNAFGPARPTRSNRPTSNVEKWCLRFVQWGANGNPLTPHSMASRDAQGPILACIFALKILDNGKKWTTREKSAGRRTKCKENQRKLSIYDSLLLKRCCWTLNHSLRALVQGNCAGTICAGTDVHVPWNDCSQGERHHYYIRFGFTSIPYSFSVDHSRRILFELF
jgi:hypothetical protein